MMAKKKMRKEPVMKPSAFISYVETPDLHDGVIRRVTRRAGSVHVLVHGVTGQDYDVSFAGVRNMRGNRPAGRTLYAVSEMRGHAPLRRFLFDSWDEDGQVALEIDAERFKVSRIAPRA